MFVEGTLRWQVTEDCPWDLLMALALRDLGRLSPIGDPCIPELSPAVAPAMRAATGTVPVQREGGRPARDQAVGRMDTGPVRPASEPDRVTGPDALREQWLAWFELTVDRERRPIASLLRPPHFEAFDRALELQDLVMANYQAALAWTRERHAEYAATSVEQHAARAADIVDVVQEREHVLRRQAGYFRLDLYVLPLAEAGAWIVGPHTVIVSTSLRDDSAAFRAWFTPMVAALV
ncbi:hypothetical protein [Leifsonia poae]|uniref:Uncharacterized protein n=1 Tax=Leifsonia poae TaxID=110933 RepID=A0A9W6HD22_9MICO|nr:hypothetical protein [Leifsonia poae]GLJ77830.1 hypothetical protein GCM10017584_34040 [Leifsonia poae]